MPTKQKICELVITANRAYAERMTWRIMIGNVQLFMSVTKHTWDLFGHFLKEDFSHTYGHLHTTHLLEIQTLTTPTIHMHADST